jgi:hypothetical protein
LIFYYFLRGGGKKSSSSADGAYLQELVFLLLALAKRIELASRLKSIQAFKKSQKPFFRELAKK